MKHTHPSNLTHSVFRKISYLLLMLVALSKSDVQADDSTNNDFPLSTSFKISTIISDWSNSGKDLDWDENFSPFLSSNFEAGGTSWEAEYFGIWGTNWHQLRCGTSYGNINSVIRNVSPLPYPISKVEISLLYTNQTYSQNLSNISIITDSPDDIEIVRTGNINSNGTITFDIENPQPDLIYQLIFSTQPTGNYKYSGWLEISSITFYRPLSDVPLATYSKDENGKTLSVQFISDKGDLHLIADEYDYDGNFTRHLIGSSTSSNSPARAPQQYPDNWTNKVADQNTAYTVEKPDAADRMVLIRAKSVTGDSHSSETQTILTSEGIVTGINQVFDNQSLSTLNDYDEYFDLQGRKINRPSTPGIYLHRTPAGTQKVIIH